MGTFAETAIIDYRLSFANLGKQTYVFRLHLQQTNKLPFVCLLQIYILYYIQYIFSIFPYICIYILLFCPGDFPQSVYHLLIVITEVCRLSVYWQKNKQKLSVCKRAKRTKRTCPSMLETVVLLLTFVARCILPSSTGIEVFCHGSSGGNNLLFKD